jgi:hypothetical protein
MEKGTDMSLLHEAAVEGKHKTIQSFATYAMISLLFRKLPTSSKACKALAEVLTCLA